MLAMRQDAGCDITHAAGGRRRQRVSDILLQMQADLLRIPVDRPAHGGDHRLRRGGAGGPELRACGADIEELTALRRSQRVFLPQRHAGRLRRATTACGSGRYPARRTGSSIERGSEMNSV